MLVSCFEIPIHTNTHQFIPIHTNTSFSKLDISIISPFLSPWLVHHVQILGPKMGFLALGCLVKPSKSNTSCVIQRGQKRHFSLDCCSQVSTQKVKTISVVFRVRDFFGGGEQLPMACRFQLSFWRALGNYFARTGWLREVLGGLWCHILIPRCITPKLNDVNYDKTIQNHKNGDLNTKHGRWRGKACAPAFPLSLRRNLSAARGGAGRIPWLGRLSCRWVRWYCLYTYIDILYRYIHTYMHVYIYIYTHVYIYVYIHMYKTHIHIHIHIHTYIHPSMQCIHTSIHRVRSGTVPYSTVHYIHTWGKTKTSLLYQTRG